MQVLRRAVRWDLTTSDFSSRAVIADLKLKLPPNVRISEVMTNWRHLAKGEFVISIVCLWV